MGEVFLTCGHTDHIKTDGWKVRFKTYSEKGERAVAHDTVCTTCFINSILNWEIEGLIYEDWEEQDWFNDD